ncbi:MAG TPA: 16S rRNA (cytosine(1402)-N(4))-methyltransferase RsmH, partial [Actinobacteria bacterium]|nr:16S rRNA (cytosine(1402)-N(4))-methyltransferase RsmH [Actinomycetota bacterium]
MEYDHKSVLLAEVVKQLHSKTGGTLVDCTLGGAGHARAILENIGTESLFIGIDRDDTALAAAKIVLENFSQQLLLVKGNFKDLDQLLKGKVDAVDGFLFDLGVSSIHFDIPARGFSYKNDGPLDMRMDKSQKVTAATIVNEYSRNELHQIIRDYGEERWASRIAQFIVEARERKSLESTLELVQVIKNAIPAKARRKGPHPAKRTFQAFR